MIESQFSGWRKKNRCIFGNSLRPQFFNKFKTEFSWEHMQREGWCNATDRQGWRSRESLGHKMQSDERIQSCLVFFFFFWIAVLTKNVSDAYHALRIKMHWKELYNHSTSRDLISDWEIKASSKKITNYQWTKNMELHGWRQHLHNPLNTWNSNCCLHRAFTPTC